MSPRMKMLKKALITGITGQDGSYLAEYLLDKGYEVHGIIRRSSNFNTERIDHIYEDPHDRKARLFLHYGDSSDTSVINYLIDKISPDEVYNLSAQSHVKISFELPEYTGDIVALGTLRFLEAIRRYMPDIKFYQASSSEMYGKVVEVPQNENTPFYPRSPYGVAKVYAHWITVNYRESYGIFACSGILFNHESPRRGKTFVTRKITRGLSRIVLGKDDTLYLGNLESKRDWGYAKDYVEAMRLMLQYKKADDYVISTGESHSVREFVEQCCKYFDIELIWKGKGIDEVGIDKKTGKKIIKIDPKYFRPAEVDFLLGDSSKAKKVLGWKPKTTFENLTNIMCKADFNIEKAIKK